MCVLLKQEVCECYPLEGSSCLFVKVPKSYSLFGFWTIKIQNLEHI